MTTARIRASGSHYAASINHEIYKFCPTVDDARLVIESEIERRVTRAGLMTPMLAAMVKGWSRTK